MADGITHNSATIRWTVASLSYDPEMYVVQYGQAMDSLTMTSSMVMGDVTPLNYMDQFQGFVTLIGLDRLWQPTSTEWYLPTVVDPLSVQWGHSTQVL